MSTDSNRRLEELVEEIRALPVEEREEALRRRCAGDERLLEEARRLLLPEGTTLAGEPESSNLAPAGPSLRPGDRVGHFRVLERLGEGGFAVVYLAEQEEPVDRRVALKIVKPGMDTREVISRFEAERQALAMMDHPNVAKVFDAGATEGGRPFFAMEYVPGEPITSYCDRHRLSTDERLELFVQACHAIQHAHQKGIIHRDIKPANVLVAAIDDKPRVRVIDFGVAKAIHQRLTERTLYTHHGQMIGTPEYMSPEQAEMGMLDIDTRTDIYSLGVLLYELVTGTLPFESAELRQAGFVEIQRLIREQEPPRPSTRISAAGDRATRIATLRRTDPSRLIRRLRGDLEWIVMKAMEKDRTRRYETASELAADIGRYLDHRPVLAGPPSTLYRLKKFVGRHRAGVAAAAAVLVVLCLGIATTSAALWREARQRERAELQASIAQTVNDFLNQDVLAAVAPSGEEGRGRDVLMREVLDEAARQIDAGAAPGGRFEGQPLVEASIRQTIGETYHLLGVLSQAERHLGRAHRILVAERGALYAETLEVLHQLGSLALSQGDYQKAERLLKRAAEGRREILGEGDPATLSSREDLAATYVFQGRYEEAEAISNRLLEVKSRVLGEDHPQTLEALHNLAMLYSDLERFEQAESLYRRLVEARKRELGPEHPNTLTAMNNLAVLYKRMEEYGKAESLYLEVLEISRRILGEEHPSTLLPLGNLGLLYQETGRYEEAAARFEHLIEVRRRVQGEDHPFFLFDRFNLAAAYSELGRLEEARELLERTISTAPRAWPPDGGWFLGDFLTGYGAVLIELDEFGEAEEALLEAHDILSAHLPPGHTNVRQATELLVDLYQKWGRSEQESEWRGRLSSTG